MCLMATLFSGSTERRGNAMLQWQVGSKRVVDMKSET